MKKVKALTVPEGDGVVVKRLMPVHGLMNFDPFVLCDHFDVDSGGFPDHPHRGFEAITYMLSGGMLHADNLGNRSTVTGGGLQRFTAGKGLVHSETPEGRACGFQLWVNLPRALKSIEPGYQQVDVADMPFETNDGVEVRTMVGEGSPTVLQTPVLYLDVSLHKGSLYQKQIPEGFRGFVYMIEGEALLNKEPVKETEAVFFEKAPLLSFMAQEKSRMILCFGRPHGEPIYQHGSFVD